MLSTSLIVDRRCAIITVVRSFATRFMASIMALSLCESRALVASSNTNILGFLCTGDETNKYYALNSEQKIIDALIEELDKIFEGKASTTYTGEYIMENWGKHKYTQGTWTQAFQEKKSQLSTLNQSIENKVYFAGEIYDPYRQMGLPGAILSGYYTIDRLLNDEK